MYDADNDDIVNAYEKGGIWLVDTAEVVPKAGLPKFAPMGQNMNTVSERITFRWDIAVIEKMMAKMFLPTPLPYSNQHLSAWTYGTIDGTIAQPKMGKYSCKSKIWVCCLT